MNGGKFGTCPVCKVYINRKAYLAEGEWYHRGCYTQLLRKREKTAAANRPASWFLCPSCGKKKFERYYSLRPCKECRIKGQERIAELKRGKKRKKKTTISGPIMSLQNCSRCGGMHLSVSGVCSNCQREHQQRGDVSIRHGAKRSVCKTCCKYTAYRECSIHKCSVNENDSCSHHQSINIEIFNGGLCMPK